MTDRERLIGLIANGRNCPTASCCDCKYYFFEAPDDRPRCNVDALLADTLIDNGVTFQRWIPVTERLPEENDVYMVSTFDGHDRWITFIQWQNRIKRWYLTGARSYWKVTHWMPLPEQPKE